MNMLRRPTTVPSTFLLRKLYAYLYDTPGPTYVQIRQDNPGLSEVDLVQRLLRLEIDGWVYVEKDEEGVRYWAKVWV